MKLKNILLLLILAGATVYGGIKGYIHHQAGARLDELVRIAAPFVRIEYDGISSRLEGVLAVDGVRLSPTDGYDLVTLRRVEIEGDGLGFLFDLGEGFARQPPTRLKARLLGMEVPLAGTLRPSLGMAGEDAGCTLAGVLRHADLKALGHTLIDLDADAEYLLDTMAGELSLRLGYRMHGLQSLSAEILVGGVGELTALATSEVPEVRRVDIRYTLEPEYIKALIGHCAGQGGVAPQHFVNGLFQQESGHYLRTLGIVPGPGLMEALKELVTQGGEVRLRAEPAPGLKPQALQGYRPEDAVRMLGLSVSVNERPVTDLSYSHQGGGRGAAARAEAGAAPEEAARRPQRQYYAPVGLDQLERYPGR
ncbi:MAG: hypothetical protein B0D84_02815 [Candidatus Sedimenticola endophacoides]|uniref:Uncharacterized protein n=1 Tax=Candidatus Sedimenticola endophacoides TaxID=2548426 RepID=A0A657PNC9_9GAMM|nr:MAG: hypothetical protein B0D84_02815 [Candidatus Sedimenticola endophacoides]